MAQIPSGIFSSFVLDRLWFVINSNVLSTRHYITVWNFETVEELSLNGTVNSRRELIFLLFCVIIISNKTTRKGARHCLILEQNALTTTY